MRISKANIRGAITLLFTLGYIAQIFLRMTMYPDYVVPTEYLAFMSGWFVYYGFQESKNAATPPTLPTPDKTGQTVVVQPPKPPSPGT